MAKVKGSGGVIWAVRYADDKGRARQKSLVRILADEIDDLLDEWDETGKDWTSEDLARALITNMDMGASGAGGYVAENEAVREGIRVGVPVVPRLDKMAERAVKKARLVKAETGVGTNEYSRAMGKVEGLVQALAFVRSPTTWENGDQAKRRGMVSEQMQRIARVR